MKRIWIQRIGAAVLCAVLLAGCMPGGPAADSTASADPLTGQEQQYPGQRPAAVVIDNAPGSTPQWGIGSASVVLEAAARADAAPSLCLVYPSVSAMPTVGPVTLGIQITPETGADLSLNDKGEVDLDEGYVIGKAADVFGAKIYESTSALDTALQDLTDAPAPAKEEHLEPLKKSITLPPPDLPAMLPSLSDIRWVSAPSSHILPAPSR